VPFFGNSPVKKIDCNGLEIRDSSGKVLFESIVDLLIGEQETNEYMDYHPVVISLPRMAGNVIGEVFIVWNTLTHTAFCACQIERSHIDFQRNASKVEGKHITATRFDRQ